MVWAGLRLFGGSCIPTVFVSPSSLTHMISFPEPVGQEWCSWECVHFFHIAMTTVASTLLMLTCDGWAHQVRHRMKEVDHAKRWRQRGGPHYLCSHYGDQGNVGSIKVPKSTRERHEKGETLKHWETQIAQPIQCHGKEVANIPVILQTPTDGKNNNENETHGSVKEIL